MPSPSDYRPGDHMSAAECRERRDKHAAHAREYDTLADMAGMEPGERRYWRDRLTAAHGMIDLWDRAVEEAEKREAGE